MSPLRNEGTSLPHLGLSIARIGLVIGLMAATYLVLRPFLAPMAWAAIVAFMTWGLYARMRDWTGRPALTAAGFAVFVLLIFGLPAVSLMVLIAEQATRLAEAGQAWIGSGAPLPSWIANLSYVGPRLVEIYQEAMVDLSRVEPVLGQLGRFVSGLLLTAISGALGNTVDFLFTVILLYVLYVNGEQLVASARGMLMRLFPDRPPEFLGQVGAVVRAVVIGVVGTAIIQGTVAGVGFAIFGVPYAAALGALTILLSFVPAGPLILWGPACAWLFALGSKGSAIGLLLWSVLLVSSIDNVMRPILIRRSGSVEIPFVVVLFGALGGIATFGLLGLLLGPVILSVSFALLSEMSQDPAARATEPGRTGSDPGD